MLDVSHVPQTNPQGRNSCVPASLSMVLAYHGIALSEGELCDLLDTQFAGTEVWNILLLEEHIENCYVELDSASLEKLQESLTANSPPIAIVATNHLSYWQYDVIHAVVVVDIADETVYINDPMFLDVPRPVPREEFLAAWSELDFLAVVVTVKRNGDNEAHEVVNSQNSADKA